MVTRQEVLSALREVIDPEIGANLVDLGLIRELDFYDLWRNPEVGEPFGVRVIPRPIAAALSVARGRISPAAAAGRSPHTGLRAVPLDERGDLVEHVRP